MKEFKHKTLLVSMLSLVFILVLLAAVTIAWFAMNKVTTSNGMRLTVEVTPNLIIAKSEELIRAVTQSTAGGAFSIDYSSEAGIDMSPAQLDWDFVGGTSTGLIYVTNTHDVDYASGLQKTDGPTLNYAAAINTTGKTYYIDYDIYIASVGKEFEAEALTATVSCDTSKDSHMAATIVFYKDSVSKTNMINYPISIAEKSSKTARLVLTENIPLNTDELKEPVHLIARCFFDGSLLKTAGTAYINSLTVDPSDLVISITITAEEPAAEPSDAEPSGEG
jgi:hypothetical protein